MARIVRPMFRDSDGLPLVGDTRRCLLVVRPTGPNADVDLSPAGDAKGNVISNDKGLSVVDDWRKLPGYQIPEHLEDDENGASGKNMEIYVHGNGTGPFAQGPVAAGLELILKKGSADRGVIRPVATVPLARYQADLQATRADWEIDES